MSNDNKQEGLEEYLIHSYSRKEAISDGVLIDIEERFPGILKRTGFNCPIALTATAFSRYVELNPNSNPLESETGRLLDILSMLRLKIKLTQKNRSDSILHFRFLCTVPSESNPFAFERLEESENEEDEEMEDWGKVSLDDLVKRFHSMPKLCTLKSVVSGNDDLTPCMTIMFPGED